MYPPSPDQKSDKTVSKEGRSQQIFYTHIHGRFQQHVLYTHGTGIHEDTEMQTRNDTTSVTLIMPQEPCYFLYQKFKMHIYQICPHMQKEWLEDHKWYLYAHGFSNFPELNNATDSRARKNHPRGVIVKQIKEDNKLTNKAHNNSLCRESFHRFILVPKLDVCEKENNWTISCASK